MKTNFADECICQNFVKAVSLKEGKKKKTNSENRHWGRGLPKTISWNSVLLYNLGFGVTKSWLSG